MKGEDMTVNEIIKLLNKEENKFGGATGKERELNLSVNGDFIGTIKNAKLDGWGDGLVTDVTLEVEVDSIKYHDEKIRNKAIDEFVERIEQYCSMSEMNRKMIQQIAEEYKPKTQADKIRSMSDEELADYIVFIGDGFSEKIPYCKSTPQCTEILDSGRIVPNKMCIECLVKWLQSEAE